jgi:hypothetical protein
MVSPPAVPKRRVRLQLDRLEQVLRHGRIKREHESARHRPPCDHGGIKSPHGNLRSRAVEALSKPARQFCLAAAAKQQLHGTRVAR